MEKIRVRKDILFYIFFISCLIINYTFETSTIISFDSTAIHYFLQLCSLISIIFCLLLKKTNLKTFLAIIFLNMIGVLCYISTGNTNLLFTMLAVTMLPKNSLNIVLKVIFRLKVILIVFIIILSIIGIIPNIHMSVSKYSYVTFGYTLGFTHTNILAAEVSSTMFLYMYIRKDKINKIMLCKMLLMTILLYTVARSRTSLLLCLFGILLISLQNYNITKRIIFKCLPYIYIITILIIIIDMILYARLGMNNYLVKFINDSLYNGRIGLAYRSLLVYPISFFGINLDLNVWNKYQYYALDNGQVMLFLNYGIIGFASYFWLFQRNLLIIKKSENVLAAIIMIVFIIWSSYEGSMYFLGKNFTLLFIGLANGKILKKSSS